MGAVVPRCHAGPFSKPRASGRKAEIGEGLGVPRCLMSIQLAAPTFLIGGRMSRCHPSWWGRGSIPAGEDHQLQTFSPLDQKGQGFFFSVVFFSKGAKAHPRAPPPGHGKKCPGGS